MKLMRGFKFSIFLFFIAVSFLGVVAHAAAQVDVSSGLVGYWAMDEGAGSSAIDSSGNGNNGTWKGTPSGSGGTYYTSGIAGSSAGAFDGGTNYISIPSTPALQAISSAGSVSVWINYAVSTTTTRAIVDLGGTGSHGLVIFGSSGAGGGDPGLQYGVGSSSVLLYANSALSPGGWNLITMTWTSAGAKTYVNGVLKTSNSVAPSITVSPTTIYVGANSGIQRFMLGAIDDLRIYNTALSAAQVTALYNMKNASTPTPAPAPSPTPSNNPPPVVGSVTVNTNNVDQEIDGFGASTAFEFSPLTSAQADLFFSTSTGVGLSLLRTAVPNDGSCTSVNSTCAGEISDMKMAAARGARVWSTSWSPPASMSTNSKVNCNAIPAPGHLATSSYAAFANYLSNYIASVASQGVSLYALSPQNEPANCMGYSSSNWTGQNFHDFIENNLGPTLALNNQASTKIMMPEPAHSETTQSYADATMNDPAAASYVSILGYHGYSNAMNFTSPYPASGKNLWETEVSALAGGNSSLTLCNDCFDPSMANGLLWAQVINNNLVVSQDSAWNYWWFVTSYNGGDDEALASGPSTQTTKRLYVLGNYSKFVRPGWYRVDATVAPAPGISVSAFKDPSTGNFAIVAINTNASDTSVAFNLNGISANSVTPWVTSANSNLVAQSNIPVAGSSFTPVLAAQSVTTFVGLGQASVVPPSPVPTTPPPSPSPSGSGSVTSGGGGGGGAFYLPSVGSVISIATSTSSSSTLSIASLQALIASLTAQLHVLEAQLQSGGASSATSTTLTLSRNLSFGMAGSDVKQLQQYLIQANRGPAAQKLAARGATLIFGSLTKAALIEFQEAVGIRATGYFGPITNAYVSAHGQ